MHDYILSIFALTAFSLACIRAYEFKSDSFVHIRASEHTTVHNGDKHRVYRDIVNHGVFSDRSALHGRYVLFLMFIQ